MAARSWTAEMVEQLKVLWAEGKTGSQIANIMGLPSRNSVIGKVHRLGLQHMERKHQPRAPRPNIPRPPRAPKIVVPRTTKPRKLPREVIKMIISGNVVYKPVLLQDRHWSQCAYPINDGNPYLFCGEQIGSSGLQYCPHHKAIIFQTKKSAA